MYKKFFVAKHKKENEEKLKASNRKVASDSRLFLI